MSCEYWCDYVDTSHEGPCLPNPGRRIAELTAELARTRAFLLEATGALPVNGFTTPDEIEQAELVEEALHSFPRDPLAAEVLRLRAVVERLERVEAAAREVVKHYETTDWDAHEVADYHRQDMMLDALARELARPAGDDGGN